MSRRDVSRRRFLFTGALGLFGAAAAAQDKEDPDLDFSMEEEDAPRVRQYNTLGKTGLKVSDISLGMARETSVIHYALDQGINFFDTAESYYKGQHEIALGRALKGLREKVVITTKHFYNPAETLTRKAVMDRFDESLARLGFEHVDIAMLHQVDDPTLFARHEILEAYEALRKAGKVGHIGFSTHQAERVCPAAFDANLFSVMMVIYNSVQYPERSELVKRAGELGIGVIAMKTMMGKEQDRLAELADRKTTYSQAAIKWALTDPDVNSVVLTMRTFEHIDEYLGASGQKLTDDDLKALKKYVKAVDDRYCRVGCRTCLAACPHKVAIHDIMRFGMYFENYGEEQRAMQDYARLRETRQARLCRACPGHCRTACPHNLPIQERLSRYDTLLRI